ncbi:MAG: hypothetical protein HN672_01375 [Chloroflexi bacterium]|nr:hypothetical protein [Chloroflexota bacterium]
MSTLIAIFTLALATILQTTIFVEMKLLQGSADFVLLTLLGWILHERTEGHWQWGVLAGLFTGFASELPIWVTVFGYLLVVLAIQYLHSKIWQAPMVILFVSIIVGSILVLFLDTTYLVVIGVQLPFLDSLNLVILPSVILNMLFILPVYALMGELVKISYPGGEEI